MNKKLLLAVSLAIVLLTSGSASAHVLIKDQEKGTGAILHVNPDDDPIAGERASLFFDIRDSSIAPRSSQATLTIINGQGSVAAMPSVLRGSSVSATYIFPSQGLYQIRLVIKQDSKVTHEFVQSQRVSRGTIGVMSPAPTRPWAEIGMLVAALGIITLAIVAFNRRDAINEYSKW